MNIAREVILDLLPAYLSESQPGHTHACGRTHEGGR